MARKRSTLSSTHGSERRKRRALALDAPGSSPSLPRSLRRWRSMRAVEELFRQWRADLTSDPMEWVCEISRIGLRHGYGMDMHGYGRVEMGAAALRLARHHHYHQHHISTTLISTPASRHPPRLHDLALVAPCGSSAVA